MKINVQKLQGMGFKIENHTPWGDCIVVPEKEFKENWESELDIQGHPCVHTEIASKKLVLVRLMGEKLLEVGVMTPTESVKPAKRLPGWFKNNPEKMWGDDEKEKLIKLWNQKPRLSVPKMAKEFANRTEGALYAELHVLQKAEVIEPRHKKHHEPSKDKIERTEASEATSEKPSPKTVTQTVKIICHTCKGMRLVIESLWPHRLPVTVKCPECEGRGWVPAQLMQYSDNTQEVEHA